MRSPAWAPGEDISGKDDKDRKGTKDLKDKKKERPAPLSSLSLVSLVSLSSLPGPDVAHGQEGDVVLGLASAAVRRGRLQEGLGDVGRRGAGERAQAAADPLHAELRPLRIG